MRKIFKTMLGGAVLLALPLFLTSCEDILGHWERPSAATITMAPTAVTNEIYAGSSTALVTIATADGGTVMYKVTTTNERPTSTEGFTATVPTAEDLTDFGTYYVWYYVEGEGTHFNSAISATAVEVFLLPSLSTPLTMEAITAGTIKITSPKANMKYKKNNESIETITSTDDKTISVSAGDKIEFYGNGTSIDAYYESGVGTKIAGGTAQVKVYGNIMSLIDEMGFASNETLTKPNTFYHLFHNNTTLTDASCLVLPATTLMASCYSAMFQGCTYLTKAPMKLPAGGEKGTLADRCYEQMFVNCSALTTAPELPATTMQAYCYSSMFAGCTSLENAPQLPATTMQANCYTSMFMGCTSLEKAPKLPATDLANQCYFSMFRNCTSLNEAWVKANCKAGSPGYECYYMFDGCTNASTSKFHTGDTKDHWTTAFANLSDWQFSAYE